MWYRIAQATDNIPEPMVWGKLPEQSHPATDINGIPLQSVQDPEFYRNVPDAPVHTPPWPKMDKWTNKSTGVIFTEPDGRVWLYEPSGHYGGYENTFSKGQLEPDLTEQQNALKEAHEELGLQGEINGYLGDFVGDTSVSRFYLGHRTGGHPSDAHWEADKVKLVHPQHAQKLLNKPRDQQILQMLQQKLQGG